MAFPSFGRYHVKLASCSIVAIPPMIHRWMGIAAFGEFLDNYAPSLHGAQLINGAAKLCANRRATVPKPSPLTPPPSPPGKRKTFVPYCLLILGTGNINIFRHVNEAQANRHDQFSTVLTRWSYGQLHANQFQGSLQARDLGSLRPARVPMLTNLGFSWISNLSCRTSRSRCIPADE